MTRSVWRSVLALVPALLASGLWVALATRFSPTGGDFTAFYVGATIARSGNFGSLHDEALQNQVAGPYKDGRPGPVYFVRPHVYAAILSPLAALEFHQAYYAFWVAQGLLLIGIFVWSWRRFGPDSVILLSLFPPAILAMGFGQDPVVFLTLGVLSYALHERKRPVSSGVALGLAIIKPHLLLLAPLAMLIQKRWRMFGGFCAGAAIDLGLSLALGGFKGLRLYFDFLRRQGSTITPDPEHMINLEGMLTNFGVSGTGMLHLALVLVVIVAFALVCRQASTTWWPALAAAGAGSILIAPHVFMYDGTQLLLGALLLFYQSKTVLTKVAGLLIFMPLPYLIQMAGSPWAAAPSLLVIMILMSLAAKGKAAWEPESVSEVGLGQAQVVPAQS